MAEVDGFRRRLAACPPCSARQRFESFAHVFGFGSRVFAVLGRLRPAPDGRLRLRDFLAALSWFCPAWQADSSVAALLAHIERAGWQRVADPLPAAAFRSHELTLSVRVAAAASGTEAFHVFLGHGSTEPAAAQYLGLMLPPHARRILGSNPSPPPPVTGRQLLPAPHGVQAADLARLLRREPCTVLTGAGVSTASGIGTFTGPGSLDARMQLAGPSEEPFAGSALDWMLHRPARLASLIGSSQAPFLTARPNAAHRALARLQRRGVVGHLLTTNYDDLHQAAGSVRVKELSGGTGAGDLGGKVLLAVGVSRDEHGLVAAARAAGMTVVVLNPEVPPLVQPTDLYLQGRAEVVLPRLVGMLGL